MMWKTHFVVGISAPVLVGDIAGILPALIGSIAPDWMEQAPRLVGRDAPAHRTVTHIVMYWLIAVVIGFAIGGTVGLLPMWFAWGGLSHVLADMFTPMGVPVMPNSRHRTNLLGGRVRTGSSVEYVIMGLLCVLMALAIRSDGIDKQSQYVPFFPDWYGRYEDGLIDKYELKTNRMKFF